MKRPNAKSIGICCVMLLWASLCFASGGMVTYPDGKPVIGANVHIDLDGVEKFKSTTDASGRFVLPADEFLNAMVQIKAHDGKDFAPISLPVKMFESGKVTIVLQSTK